MGHVGAGVALAGFRVGPGIDRQAGAFFFYEELGWALIYAANTFASAFIYITVRYFRQQVISSSIHLLFGALYLPWQINHLRFLRLPTPAGGRLKRSTSKDQR